MGFGRGALLWLLGIPLPIIILLAFERSNFACEMQSQLTVEIFRPKNQQPTSRS
jgi:hypothetical protein